MMESLATTFRNGQRGSSKEDQKELPTVRAEALGSSQFRLIPSRMSGNGTVVD
jgi:hypothetical protein